MPVDGVEEQVVVGEVIHGDKRAAPAAQGALPGLRRAWADSSAAADADTILWRMDFVALNLSHVPSSRMSGRHAGSVILLGVCVSSFRYSPHQLLPSRVGGFTGYRRHFPSWSVRRDQ